MDNSCVAICCGNVESVTRAVNANLPVMVGVPAISPLLFMASPSGNAPEMTDQ